MLSKFKRRIRRAILGYDVSSYYFSQSGEDHIAYSLLSPVIKSGRQGFFVDIGAYHPTVHSNTYLFYRLGWNGINVDARKGSMQLFDKIRPRDINIEIGVGLEEGLFEFNEVGDKGLMNSFSLQNLENLHQTNRIHSTYQVEVCTLKSILGQYLKEGQTIELMSIDVEGLDLAVLKSNDWTQFRPSVLIVEAKGTSIYECQETELYSYVVGLRYSLVGKTVVVSGVSSLIFCSDEYLQKALIKN